MADTDLSKWDFDDLEAEGGGFSWDDSEESEKAKKTKKADAESGSNKPDPKKPAKPAKPAKPTKPTQAAKTGAGLKKIDEVKKTKDLEREEEEKGEEESYVWDGEEVNQTKSTQEDSFEAIAENIVNDEEINDLPEKESKPEVPQNSEKNSEIETPNFEDAEDLIDWDFDEEEEEEDAAKNKPTDSETIQEKLAADELDQPTPLPSPPPTPPTPPTPPKTKPSESEEGLEDFEDALAPIGDDEIDELEELPKSKVSKKEEHVKPSVKKYADLPEDFKEISGEEIANWSESWAKGWDSSETEPTLREISEISEPPEISNVKEEFDVQSPDSTPPPIPNASKETLDADKDFDLNPKGDSKSQEPKIIIPLGASSASAKVPVRKIWDDEPKTPARSKLTENDLANWWKALMAFVSEKRVTDIIFNAEKKEVFCRINTELILYQVVGRENFERVIRHTMPPDKSDELEKKGETDYAVTTFGRRMRVNIFKSLKGIAAAYRPLPNKPIPWKDNMLSEAVMKTISSTKQGLVLVTGPTGSGKCLGYGTPVLKHDGTIVPVESLKVGDLLMGPDSKPRKVLKANPGKGKMYQINPVKGEPWQCNDAHIMTLKRSMKGQILRPDGRKRNDGEYQAFGDWFRGAKGKKRHTSPQDIVDVELQAFLERTPKKKNPSQHWKLFRTRVNFFTPKEIEKIPTDHFYYLGLWLGDGTKKANQITNIDKEIINWTKKYAKKFGYSHRDVCYGDWEKEAHRIGVSQNIGRAKKRHKDYPFIIGSRGEGFCLKTFLASCLSSPEKRDGKYPTLKSGEGEQMIPLWAKTSTKSQRLALLAGLIDTDGSLSSGCFNFVNKGKEFVNSVVFLARSLGLWASPPKGKIVKGNSYWRTTISGETSIVPTRIKRKKAPKRLQKKDPLMTGWTVEDKGEGKYFGILLDGDGRFLLGDFTVTHNSTTLCSMLEYINERHPYHIITIEDPIEYIFANKRSVIDQREVGEHTTSFQAALRASLRENPDIIFVGEIRDYDTARTALMAADTGHLVFGTLHTRRVYSTISRLLEMAPESNREEIRSMLSNSLSLILCQRLLQKRGGGIYPCREVMMLNPAISSLIKEKKEKGISSQLTINQTRGMMEWDRALDIAVESGMITKAEAEKYRDNTEKVD